MSESVAAPPTIGTVAITDDSGRRLEVRALNLLEEMDLIEAAGSPTPPERWMMIATFASCVRSIDGVPNPFPTKRLHIRPLVSKVGAAGLRAAVKALAPEDVPEGAAEAIEAQPLEMAKN